MAIGQNPVKAAWNILKPTNAVRTNQYGDEKNPKARLIQTKRPANAKTVRSIFIWLSLGYNAVGPLCQNGSPLISVLFIIICEYNNLFNTYAQNRCRIFLTNHLSLPQAS
jgi:hypothetical protein